MVRQRPRDRRSSSREEGRRRRRGKRGGAAASADLQTSVPRADASGPHGEGLRNQGRGSRGRSLHLNVNIISHFSRSHSAMFPYSNAASLSGALFRSNIFSSRSTQRRICRQFSLQLHMSSSLVKRKRPARMVSVKGKGKRRERKRRKLLGRRRRIMIRYSWLSSVKSLDAQRTISRTLNCSFAIRNQGKRWNEVRKKRVKPKVI